MPTSSDSTLVIAARTGVVLGVSMPLPSWPRVLSPQHHTVASFRSAHVCLAPTATDMTLASGICTGVLVGLRTITGAPTDESIVVGIEPQHHSVRSVLIPHVVLPPAATEMASVKSEGVNAAVRTSEPFPS